MLDQPIFRSFEGALSFFETFFRSGASASRSPEPHGTALDLRLTRSLAPIAAINAVAIPHDATGKTFVYDPTSQSYVSDPAATGAPATGVRYVLYAWDATNVRPASPLTRVGYVDITPLDAGGGGPALTEIFVLRDAPRLPIADFVTMHGTSGGVNTFGIEGSATDGFTVDLITLSGTESGGASQHHLVFNSSLSSSPPGVSTDEQLTLDQATASQMGKLELSYDGHKVTDESVGGGLEVRFDGGLYARILFSSTSEEKTRYVRPDGTPRADQEVADLNALIDRAAVANFFWISLAWP